MLLRGEGEGESGDLEATEEEGERATGRGRGSGRPVAVCAGVSCCWSTTVSVSPSCPGAGWPPVCKTRVSYTQSSNFIFKKSPIGFPKPVSSPTPLSSIRVTVRIARLQSAIPPYVMPPHVMPPLCNWREAPGDEVCRRLGHWGEEVQACMCVCVCVYVGV